MYKTLKAFNTEKLKNGVAIQLTSDMYPEGVNGIITNADLFTLTIALFNENAPDKIGFYVVFFHEVDSGKTTLKFLK